MDIQFAKYKELIEQQLEELTAEDVLGQSAQKTVELDQQSVGRLSRMDALQSQAMAQAQQRRRDAHKQALQAALLTPGWPKGDLPIARRGYPRSDRPRLWL